MARGSGIRRRSRRMRRGGKMGAAAGAVVKAVSAGSEVDETSSAGSAGEGWIYVRGHKIQKAGLHIDPHGNVYVPDSEDEESGMEDQACGRHVSAGKELAMGLNPQETLVLAADEDSRMTVPTEVPEELKEVLANMDPIYHDVFVNMYKILVPICFRSFHR